MSVTTVRGLMLISLLVLSNNLFAADNYQVAKDSETGASLVISTLKIARDKAYAEIDAKCEKTHKGSFGLSMQCSDKEYVAFSAKHPLPTSNIFTDKLNKDELLALYENVKRVYRKARLPSLDPSNNKAGEISSNDIGALYTYLKNEVTVRRLHGEVK